MAIIHVLDSDTINKIAAGEVVERPASVVKELVENAIDAKATAITVEIKDGGTSLIRVTDNGRGIEREDIPLAFLRHSTSKIKSVEDLFVVTSLGFRGEALSSIASVAQVELITKPSDALLGGRYLIEGGVERTIEDIGCPAGTTIIVRNLFYNTPARRKFLKSDTTEAGYVSDLMQRLALSHPEISFKFMNNQQNRMHTSGNMQLKDIIYNIYGREITANLLWISQNSKNAAVSGFVGKPLISRGNRSYENYYINGRYIKSPVITKAIEEAYKTFMMVHKYPFTALHFQMDSSLIDINVHPTKMELRFRDNDEIYQLVYHSIRDALSHKDLIPDVFLDKKPTAQDKPVSPPDAVPEPFEIARIAAVKEIKPEREVSERQIVADRSKEQRTKEPMPNVLRESAVYGVTKESGETLTEAAKANETTAADTMPILPEVTAAVLPESIAKAEQMQLFEHPLLSEEARVRHRLIGQLFETYWLVEYDGKLFIIDQHAAHEKVLYEKIIRRMAEKDHYAQYIEPPIILTLSMQEEALLKRFHDNFTQIGFEIEHFGGSEYTLRAVPADLFGFTERDMFMDLLDQLALETGRMHSDIINDKIATMACKAAVKGNQLLSFQEADALIEQLLKAENPYNCPHGRPTIIAMPKYELEKKFKRIQ